MGRTKCRREEGQVEHNKISATCNLAIPSADRRLNEVVFCARSCVWKSEKCTTRKHIKLISMYVSHGNQRIAFFVPSSLASHRQKSHSLTHGYDSIQMDFRYAYLCTVGYKKPSTAQRLRLVLGLTVVTLSSEAEAGQQSVEWKRSSHAIQGITSPCPNTFRPPRLAMVACLFR